MRLSLSYIPLYYIVPGGLLPPAQGNRGEKPLLLRASHIYVVAFSGPAQSAVTRIKQSLIINQCLFWYQLTEIRREDHKVIYHRG